MNRFALTCGVLALAGSAFAQNWTPKQDYQSTLGDSAQLYFGRYNVGKFQFGDGALRNTSAVITKISARTDDVYSYSSDLYRMGRTWTNVMIKVGPTNLATWSTTYASNHVGTPTMAYSGVWTWPTIPNGAQGARALNNYVIQAPLSTPYINPGTNTSDMILDFEFSGGTLANGYTLWTGSRSAYYYTDGFRITSVVSGIPDYYHDQNTSGCVDSNALPLFYRSYSRIFATRYSPGYPTSSFRNKLRLYTQAYYVGRSAPYVQVLGISGNAAGVPYGSGCEKLYLNFIGGELLTFGTASTSGSTGNQYYGLPTTGIPFLPSMEGARLWTQATWSDTRTAAVKLTAASSVKVPKLGISSIGEAKRRITYRYAPIGVSGFTSTSSSFQPILKYN